MNKKFIYILSALCTLLMISGCAGKSQSGSSDTVHAQQAETNQDDSTTLDDDSASTDTEILIVIDQTPKPIEGNSFDFIINQVPEGFALVELQWITQHSLLVDSVQDAIEHGANGEDFFTLVATDNSPVSNIRII